ncbi:hypothetical protein AVEN_112031-1 [Araneus ventricosus]|uniref:Uncharacterized protein n=1 Tax=Araneus ventricosus TaxID=182803 RepID=A0A4Y2QQR0_ARAVE|nr:hypothetical protein AVEN_112031-1 [Araneus ventricosus]
MDPLPVYGPIYTEFGFERPYLGNHWGDRLENCTDVIVPSRSFEPYHPLRISNPSEFSRPGFELYRDGLFFDPSYRLYSTRRIDRHLTRPICLVNGSTSGLRVHIYRIRLWEPVSREPLGRSTRKLHRRDPSVEIFRTVPSSSNLEQFEIFETRFRTLSRQGGRAR